MKKAKKTTLFTTKNIAYIAVLLAISVVMNALKIPITGSNMITFTYIPDFVAGFYFGPGAGFLVGACGDGFGYILGLKVGEWIPGKAISAGLMGAIPGLVKHIRLKEKWILLISYILTFLVCSVGLNTFVLWYTKWQSVPYGVYLVGRLPVSFLNMLANLVINAALMPVFNRIILPRLKKNAPRSKEEEAAQS